MDVIQHASCGTVVVAGGLTAVQSLLSRQLKPPSDLALSLGSFVGMFRLLEGTGRKLLARNGQRLFNASQAAIVAAAVASLFLEAERKTVVVSCASLEAALIIIKEFTSHLEAKYFDLPLGALVAGPLIETWIYQSDAIAKPQLTALDRFCQLPISVLRRMRDEIPSGKLVSRCDVFHRGRTCAQFHRDYFLKGMKFAVRLYVPVYAVSMLAPQYKRWIWGPRPSLTPLMVRYLRTCCCLTMLYQVPLGFSCLSPSNKHRSVVRMAGALTTLAFLAEHEHRRGNVMKAVGVYTTSAIATRIVTALNMPPKIVKFGQLVLLCASVAVIFQNTSPNSSRMTRILYGYSDKPASMDDERATKR